MVILPNLKQVRAEKARRSLYEFAKQAWPVIEPGVPFTDGYHIQVICEHLEAVTRGEIRDLLINMPPRHMKSILVSVLWPAWEWITAPHRKWFFASYAQNLSIRDSVKCRRLVASPWYRELWGDRFSLASDQNVKEKFENDKSGYRLASSVGGQITGEGGDRVVCDDPHNVLEAYSEVKRESVKTWWNEAMSTRLNDPKTGTRTIVMQRVHADDLSAVVLGQGGWTHLCLPARYEGDRIITALGWSDPRTEPGQLLWPERFDAPSMVKLETLLGPLAAAGQLQQRPSPKGGGMLKRDWFHRYDARPALNSFSRIFLSMDSSFKGKESSKTGKPDYNVIQVWGQIGNTFWLLFQLRGQWEFPTTKQKVKDAVLIFPQAISKLIEDKANGPAIIQDLSGSISGFVAIDPKGGKEARAAAVSAPLADGRIFIPSDAWFEENGANWGPDSSPELFLKEAETFPAGTNDDMVDAFTQAIIWAIGDIIFDPLGYSH